MADPRRGKVRRKQLKDEMEKPSKEEYAVAKFLRFSAPSREGKFLGNNAQCFLGSKAVDTLLDSKYASAKYKPTPLFTNRSTCTNYCERLLEKGFFQRAARVEKSRSGGDKKQKKGGGKEPAEVKGGKGAKEGEKTPTTAIKDAPTAIESKKKKKEEQKVEGGESASVDTTTSTTTTKSAEDKNKDDTACGEEKKKRKKKLKLEPHEKQIFIDGPEVYVWLYEPVQAKTFIIGLLLVLGAIGVCLFPLWPPEVRLGVYYLSLAAAGFVGVIISLCVLRMVLFCLVWVASLGKVTFWLLPNLTEDVGFFDSFKPLYNVAYYTPPPLTDAPAEEGETEISDGQGTETIGTTEVSGTEGGCDDEDEGSKHSGGSSQGYEVIDPEDLNCEEGGQEDSEASSAGEEVKKDK